MPRNTERTAADIRNIKEINQQKNKNTPVIAKIEKMMAKQHLKWFFLETPEDRCATSQQRIRRKNGEYHGR
ncbi:MAG: hypothetical protein AB1Z29_09525 [Desulfobacterales bacterium]